MDPDLPDPRSTTHTAYLGTRIIIIPLFLIYEHKTESDLPKASIEIITEQRDLNFAFHDLHPTLFALEHASFQINFASPSPPGCKKFCGLEKQMGNSNSSEEEVGELREGASLRTFCHLCSRQLIDHYSTEGSGNYYSTTFPSSLLPEIGGEGQGKGKVPLFKWKAS